MFVEFCIPVYNEEQLLKDNILKLLRFCQAQKYIFDWQIVIIVNGSTDNSLSIAQSLANREDKKIKYVKIEKSGKGRAIKEYIKQSQAEIVVFTDIDLAVSLKNIKDILVPLLRKEYHLVIGSRLLPGSSIKRSFLRELSSRIYNVFASQILKDGIKDHQCGFKAVRLNVFKNMDNHLLDNDWFFDTELIAVFVLQGYRVKEVPVDWKENRYDKRNSKVNLFNDSIKFIIKLLQLKNRIKKEKF